MHKLIENTNVRTKRYFSTLTLPLCFILLAFILPSCHKQGCPADQDTSFPNTVTVTDNDTDPANYRNAYFSASRKPQYPVSFSSTGPVDFKGVDVIVSREGATYTVQIATGSECPISLNIITEARSNSGTGLYQLLSGDAEHNLYFQNQPFKEAWKCVGGTVNVTTLQPNKVTGTFILQLSGSNGNKTVTGTFDANEPLVRM